MSGSLQQRIKQSQPFASTETEAYLCLIEIGQDLAAGVSDLLKTCDLSMPQYNALRILRGAGEVGLPCGGLAERMIHRVPDVTRLLDRLESRGLVTRRREAGDRRVVRVWISEPGLKAIAPLDEALVDLHRKQLGHLGERKLRQLIRLIEEARAGL
ncbi:MAG: MarR family transcriptional regulator [Candidatus Hydrogenedentes bacterium]|nr:MarR family transcriptional regulator [Candidatus Hydrogenedentota bacterium]